MRRGADVRPPPQLSGLVCRDTSSPLAEGFWDSQSQEEEHFGGRLSLEVLESWGEKVGARGGVGGILMVAGFSLMAERTPRKQGLDAPIG